MKAYERLIAAIQRDIDPKFHICRKESALVGRVHSWFSPNATVILGHTCYVPEKVLDNPSGMAQLMAHEGTHAAQRRDLGAFMFNWKYAYPFSMAAVIFLISIVLLIIGIWCLNIVAISGAVVCILTGIFYTANFEWARPRAILELEAFATSWWYFYGFTPTSDEFLIRSWISGIRQMLNSPTYLRCGLSIGSNLVNKVLFDAVQGVPSKCDRRSRDHTVSWFLTCREILLDARLRQA